MNNPETGYIQSIELAQVMAYAEVPYRDLAKSAINSAFEKMAVENLAQKAGIAAAKSYISKPGNEHLQKYAQILDDPNSAIDVESTESAEFTQSLDEFSDRENPFSGE